MTIERPSNVVGNRPMSAIAFGHHTECIFGSWRSPQRRTNAFDLYRPALRTPRSSALLPLTKIVSASSISSVGRYRSIVRYSAATVMLDVCRGRCARQLRTSRFRVSSRIAFQTSRCREWGILRRPRAHTCSDTTRPGRRRPLPVIRRSVGQSWRCPPAVHGHPPSRSTVPRLPVGSDSGRHSPVDQRPYRPLPPASGPPPLGVVESFLRARSPVVADRPWPSFHPGIVMPFRSASAERLERSLPERNPPSGRRIPPGVQPTRATASLLLAALESMESRSASDDNSVLRFVPVLDLESDPHLHRILHPHRNDSILADSDAIVRIT